MISLEKLIDLMVYAPRKRFNIPLKADDYCIWDLNREYTVDPEEFLSMGHATPFEGMKLCGRCLLTVCGGKIAYIER